MVASSETESTPTKNPTTVERKSEREFVVTRTINAPPRIVFGTCSRGGLRAGVSRAKRAA